MTTVVGLFEGRERVQEAVEALRGAGFDPDGISVVWHDPAGAVRATSELGAGGAITAGAVGGGALGGLAGLLAGAGLLAIPGIGPVLAAGPLLAALGGGAIGAATGGMIGTLAEQGLSQEQARVYQEAVARGALLVAARVPDERAEEARALMRRHGASDPAHPQEGPDAVDRATVDAKVVGLAAGGTAGAAIGGVAAGPVGAGIGAVVGAAAGGAAGAAIDAHSHAYHEVEPAFHHEWEVGPYKDSTTWDHASSAYQYGWERSERPEYRGKSWDEARDDLEAGWSGPETWDTYASLVRNAWERRARLRTEAEADGQPPPSPHGGTAADA